MGDRALQHDEYGRDSIRSRRSPRYWQIYAYDSVLQGIRLVEVVLMTFDQFSDLSSQISLQNEAFARSHTDTPNTSST